MIDGPDVGDVLRLRNYRNYASDGRSWAEYSCVRRGEKWTDKKAFTVLLLGIEPLVRTMGKEEYEKRIVECLRELGFVDIDEAVQAGADPEKLGFKRKKSDPPRKKAKKKGRRRTPTPGSPAAPE
jgi:hypothetical protein